MIRLLVSAFLIAHGLVHLTLYTVPKQPAQRVPLDPTHSWALAALHAAPATMRETSVGMATVVAGFYALAGIMLAADLAIWAGIAGVAAVTAVLLKGLWFNPWLSLGVALDLAVLVALTSHWPASLF